MTPTPIPMAVSDYVNRHMRDRAARLTRSVPCGELPYLQAFDLERLPHHGFALSIAIASQSAFRVSVSIPAQNRVPTELGYTEFWPHPDPTRPHVARLVFEPVIEIELGTEPALRIHLQRLGPPPTVASSAHPIMPPELWAVEIVAVSEYVR